MTKQHIGLEELARERVSFTPEAHYDHKLQQLVNMSGIEIATSNSDEDAGGSTTFWDGESA